MTEPTKTFSGFPISVDGKYAGVIREWNRDTSRVLREYGEPLDYVPTNIDINFKSSDFREPWTVGEMCGNLGVPVPDGVDPNAECWVSGMSTDWGEGSEDIVTAGELAFVRRISVDK